MKATIVALTLAVALTGPAFSELLLQGGEFQVNTFTSSVQWTNDVAGSASGFVVVWGGYGSANDDGEVLGQRFASSGARLGGQFQVNLYTSSLQGYPSVAMDETGFVVAWMSFGQDGEEAGVFARRFGSNGSPVATEFQVNTRTAGGQASPSVAMSGGNFVVVWHSPGDYYNRGIFGQRFSSNGTRFAEEFNVNSYVQGDQDKPSVAMDATEFVVAWQSEGQDGDVIGIFARRLDFFGFPVGVDFQVNDATAGSQTKPRVAMDGSGYVVVWESFDGVSTGVFGRRYNSGGAVQASEFHLHSDISGIEVEPALAIRGGSFVAAWNQNYAPTPDSIRARGFNSQNAAPLGDVQVNLYANQNQLRAKVARSGPGFVVVWDSQSQDGSGYGIFGRRLLLGAGLDVDGNGVVDPLTDTLLALRYAFGFRGSTLIAGAVGAGCRRCDAPSIEAYLAGMV